MTQDLLTGLNDAQRRAVVSDSRSTLVLAGAGSGKTRVLTHRIAWLIAEGIVRPEHILAVTFTNKAAAQMRDRVARLTACPVDMMWIGTFHGIAHRLLRARYREAGLPRDFQIIDAHDQRQAVRKILRLLAIDESTLDAREAVNYINWHKERAMRAEDVPENSKDPHARVRRRVYHEYEQACLRAGSVDFAELLLRVYELWRNDDTARAYYQRLFRCVLVDEFQDTNALQYQWLRLLDDGDTLFFVVGDDDQSIYSWRGAEVKNMRDFTEAFAPTDIIRLEQNYRSTSIILDAANALIAHNTERLGKKLWTEADGGELIDIFGAFNDLEEARYVIDTLRRLTGDGTFALDDIALLYRTNAQSRVLEEELNKRRIPYRIYGGVRFFERAEIKDVMAYFRLLVNRDDDTSFERVVNVPARGIGTRTVDILRETARMRGTSLFAAIPHAPLSARARGALQDFCVILDQLAAASVTQQLHETILHIADAVALYDHYAREGREKADDRMNNIAELSRDAEEFARAFVGGDDVDVRTEYATYAMLESGETQSDPGQPCVHLMTLHAAKGLEFGCVFLVGLEEGLFPSMRAASPADIAEERRLCYVGITRAQQKLVLSYAEARRLHGMDMRTQPSRFLAELPSALLHQVRMKTDHRVVADSRRMPPGMATPMKTAGAAWSRGTRVLHAKFGPGTVLRSEGNGEREKIWISFDKAGVKCLVAAIARLEALSA